MAVTPLPPPALRDFSLTHVEYTAGDPFGFPLALVTLTPVFAMVAYATLLVSRRDLGTAAMVAGQLGNEVLNYALKHALQHPRPDTASGSSPAYGMPSNHAQFMGFLAGYAAAWAGVCWRVRPAWRGAVVACAHACGLAVCFSRWYLGYHTPAQVGVGYAVGCGVGVAWFGVVQAVLRPWVFPGVAATAAARWLLVRDCTHAGDVLALEYEATVGAADEAAAAGGTGRGGARGGAVKRKGV